MQKNFSHTIRDTYTKIKRPIAIILLFIVIISQLVPIHAVQISAIGILSLILVELLIDIHKKVTEEEKTILFTDFFNVTVSMRDKILSRVNKKRTIHIRALGMSMGHAWQFISSIIVPILQSADNRIINLEIAIIDSRWDEINKINPDWKIRSEANYMEISNFIANNREVIEEKGWNISIYRYRHIPNWHGILIDEDTLFQSTCFWSGDKITGAENQYELLSSFESGSSLYKINRFKSWFNHIKNNSY